MLKSLEQLLIVGDKLARKLRQIPSLQKRLKFQKLMMKSKSLKMFLPKGF
jgi:hypothetical protein